jgi:Tfp pilus assembly PilM family ATPase
MFKQNSQNILAVDLATDAVRVLDIRLRHGVPEIKALASQTLAPGTSDALPDRHLAALEQLVAAQRLRSRSCIVSMPTSLVVTRTVQIDHNKTQSADEQVRWTLQNCIPFDPRDLVFDFWPISEDSANGRTREVLVVATQASVVQHYLQGLERLKLTCIHLDVAPCALASLIANTAANRDAMIGTVALSENVGFFAITEKQRLLFWRPFDLPANRGASAVQAGLERVGDEVSKCVSHMVGSMHIDNMAEMLIYGHGSDDLAVTEYLKNRFHLPVRSPSPFEALPAEAVSAEIAQAMPAGIATHYCTAVGLAMQQIGGANHG